MEAERQHPERYCLNCSATLTETAVYCPQCGQKDKDTRVSFFKIVKEAILAMLNLDSALLRTLPNLLIPGKLTQEFFRGRQKRYMNPVRLFLWVIIILILLIGKRTNDGEVMTVDGDAFSKIKQSWELKKALPSLDSAMEITKQYFPRYDLEPVFDSVRTLYIRQLPRQSDSVDLHGNLHIGPESDSLNVSVNDLYSLDPDTLIAKYRVEGFWNRIITKQKVKFLTGDKAFGSFFIGKLTWAALLLMPLLALLMKLLYIRRDFYYVEHLIFSIHTHTLVFTLFIIALLIGPDHESFGAIFLVMLALAGLYMLLAQKRYYKQKWFKTILKYAILLLMYNFLIAIVLVFTLIIGFFLF